MIDVCPVGSGGHDAGGHVPDAAVERQRGAIASPVNIFKADP